MEKKELRMYFFVMYNLSGIQKGIQAGHCADQYKLNYPNDEQYKDWLKNHKTYVLLSGGTSNNGFVFQPHSIGSTFEVGSYYIDETKLGSMEMYEKYLIDNNIPFASFREPDLNNSLSSLCFICGEQVFDLENYPTFFNWLWQNHRINVTPEQRKMKPPYTDSEIGLMYPDWVKMVGGEKNAKLKELVNGKQLA